LGRIAFVSELCLVSAVPAASMLMSDPP